MARWVRVDSLDAQGTRILDAQGTRIQDGARPYWAKKLRTSLVGDQQVTEWLVFDGTRHSIPRVFTTAQMAERFRSRRDAQMDTIYATPAEAARLEVAFSLAMTT